MFQILFAKLKNIEKANDYSSAKPESSFPFKQEPTNTSKSFCNISYLAVAEVFQVISSILTQNLPELSFSFFVLYFATLILSQAVCTSIVGRLVNYELKMIWNQAVCGLFAVQVKQSLYRP
jgi:hypothetical protein